MVRRNKIPGRQHLHNLALLQRLTRREVRQAANADVLQHRIQPHARVVGRVTPGDPDRHGLAALLEFPAGIRRGFAQVDTTVVTQILRLAGRAMFRQVSRRSAEQMLDQKQLATHQARRRLIGDAHAQIHVVVDQIDVAVLQNQLHIDLGISPQKLGHVRMHHVAPHRLGHADANQPFSLLAIATAEVHDRLRCPHHLLATLEHFLAHITQAQLAGGALQQADRQGLFQSGDTAADGRRRGVQLSRSLGKTADLDHPHEDHHFSQ